MFKSRTPNLLKRKKNKDMFLYLDNNPEKCGQGYPDSLLHVGIFQIVKMLKGQIATENWAYKTTANYEYTYKLYLSLLEEYKKVYGVSSSFEEFKDSLSSAPSHVGFSLEFSNNLAEPPRNVTLTEFKKPFVSNHVPLIYQVKHDRKPYTNIRDIDNVSCVLSFRNYVNRTQDLEYTNREIPTWSSAETRQIATTRAVVTRDVHDAYWATSSEVYIDTESYEDLDF